jgi:hypothetical protein
MTLTACHAHVRLMNRDQSIKRRVVSEDARLVAHVLGMSATELAAELDGRTPAQLALDHGVSPRLVVDALLARSLGRISGAVEAGRISAEYGMEAFPRLACRTAARVHRQAW